MNNIRVLHQLEQQRDALFAKLEATTISKLHQDEYDDLKSGRVFVFGNDEREMLKELKKLAKDTSLDEPYRSKLNEYLGLDNSGLILYFETEITRVINEILASKRQDENSSLIH
jgi:hypothetical protein